VFFCYITLLFAATMAAAACEEHAGPAGAGGPVELPDRAKLKKWQPVALWSYDVGAW
jgi:hypothetical protein